MSGAKTGKEEMLRRKSGRAREVRLAGRPGHSRQKSQPGKVFFGSSSPKLRLQQAQT